MMKEGDKYFNEMVITEKTTTKIIPFEPGTIYPERKNRNKIHSIHLNQMQRLQNKTCNIQHRNLRLQNMVTNNANHKRCAGTKN